MNDNSSYLNYLPPALWSKDRDPGQFLGRMLRIFEELLTGVVINTRLVRPEAPIVSASGNQIDLGDAAAAALFRVGDVLTIEGTGERAQIESIIGATLVLATPLTGAFGSGTAHLADLLVGQTAFRVADPQGLGPGTMIDIQQGGNRETHMIIQVVDAFVTLATGVSQPFPLPAGDTGVPVYVRNGVTISKAQQRYAALEATIDDLHQLFNPWQTRPEFLSWLASWVALSLRPDWDEFQQRKLISKMVSVYNLRGFKEGLHTYLDIFAVTPARPRITIDDGDSIFRLVLDDGGVAPTAYAIASGAPLLHPISFAIDDAGNYIVADQGDEGLAPPAAPGPVPASLWRMTPTGETAFTTTALPTMTPLHQGTPLFTPAGVVVETTGAYVVVDTGPAVAPNAPAVSGLYRFAPPDYVPAVVIDNDPMTVPRLSAIYPVDLVLIADGHFAVLDRGARLPNPAAPRIIVYQEGTPPTLTFHPLSSISEPTSFVRTPDGNYVVADAGFTPPATFLPADLVLVDIAPATPTETSLLSGLPSADNPLMYPSGITLEDSRHLLVTDFGSKPPGRFARLAEPPGLYRIPLPPVPPRVDLVSRDRNFVRPSDLAMAGPKTVLVLDQGESQDQSPARSWRALPNEFGVIVYFSEERPIDLIEKQQLLSSIRRIIDTEKPAHSHWTLKTNQL